MNWRLETDIKTLRMQSTFTQYIVVPKSGVGGKIKLHIVKCMQKVDELKLENWREHMSINSHSSATAEETKHFL